MWVFNNVKCHAYRQMFVLCVVDSDYEGICKPPILRQLRNILDQYPDGSQIIRVSMTGRFGQSGKKYTQKCTKNLVMLRKWQTFKVVCDESSDLTEKWMFSVTINVDTWRNLIWSMTVNVVHRTTSGALHGQWRCLHMREKFPRGRKYNLETNLCE